MTDVTRNITFNAPNSGLVKQGNVTLITSPTFGSYQTKVPVIKSVPVLAPSGDYGNYTNGVLDTRFTTVEKLIT